MPDPYQNAQFAEFFAALLSDRGLSGAQAARRLGVAQSQVSRWKRGEGGISYENLQRIHDEFGIDLAYLTTLAGLRTSNSSTALERIEGEQQMWRARFDSVMEKKVPRRAWKTYMDACEALADLLHISSPGELSTPAQRRLSDSTAESGDSDPGGDTRDLSLRYRRGRSTQQIVERLMPAGI